jgi:hypothetical protein
MRQMVYSQIAMRLKAGFAGREDAGHDRQRVGRIGYIYSDEAYSSNMTARCRELASYRLLAAPFGRGI